MPVIKKLREKSFCLHFDRHLQSRSRRRRRWRLARRIVNDVTGGRGDRRMLPLLAETKPAFIIMHMQGTPQTMQIDPRYDDVVAEVADFFRQQYARVIESGIDPMAIAFDPGIGFGKTLNII